jgi:hypothetical protein
MESAVKGLSIAIVLAACAMACSSSSASSTSTRFPVTVTSDSGALRVELSAPTAPIVGTDQMELTITRFSDGVALDDITVSVVPWMPSMLHGTASPTVTSKGGGKYLLSNLDLFMPGTWELEITFSGPVSDHAEPTFELQ